MGQRSDPDPRQIERLLDQLVLRRAKVGGVGAGDPLIRFAYLEDREALLDAVLDRVRREKHTMIAEAVAAGMTYQAIGDRVGIGRPRVMQLLRKAQAAAEREAADA